MNQPEPQDKQPLQGDHRVKQTPSKDPLPRVDTRREFVADVGKKLLYVTPIVLTLAASQAQAATGSAPTS